MIRVGLVGDDREHIRQYDTSLAIIFITNIAQYAIRGYEVDAIDFMVKPVGYFNFAKKLEKAVRYLQKRGSMKAVKEELCGLPFEECTAGCLVNLDMVWRIGKEHVYLQDAQFPLSRRMKKSFTQRYVDFIGSGF